MKKLNKIISCVMAVMMIITVLPLGAFAIDSGNDKSSVTVYLTVSDDGYFVNGNDDAQTVMARVPITVDYFDLANYNLEQYYRYETDSFENGGGYISDIVVERPTVLHLLITALEKYYLGGEKLEVNSDALNISGGATSMFMMNFWGHDYNLMYLVDHSYPLMAEGWGATADYILLEEGMEIDIGMFSNYNFYFQGGFAFFDQTEYNVSVGEEVTFNTMKANTDMYSSDLGGDPVAFPGLYTSVSNENWFEIADLTDDAADNGEFSYVFNKPGKYYVTAIDPYAGDPDESCVAPAIAVVNVNDNTNKKLEGSIYYQLKTNDTEQMRFIAEINEEDIRAANSAEICISVDDSSYNVSINKAYKSLYANGKVVTAGEGKCFIVSPTITGYDSDSQIKAEVSLDNFDNGISRIIKLGQ
ncbi:MAG: hypothetical protein K2F81_04300 [Ruminococcus sp.]|nr:hypothetical protein [Ruminococcus sp.]